MPKFCKVTLNKETFHANCGDLLLDSAIMSGVDLPHDCRSGVCGTCRVRLVEGNVFGGTEDGSDVIHACQARVVSDLKLVTEPVPEPTSVSAEVAELVRLAPDAVGVSLKLQAPLRQLPGQYCRLQFRGFPARCYSPTYPLEGAPDERRLNFHVRRLPDGLVSSALGHGIGVGPRVKLTGPYGSAFLRPDCLGRIVLVASGTGFAPMWSIAVAAIMEEPRRELMFVVATKTLQSFYMHAALCRLALFPNVKIIPVVSEPQKLSSAIRSGRPTDHLPRLSAEDVVYTAGAPAVTDTVARVAKAAGATCYTDPFLPNPRSEDDASLMSRVAGWFDNPRRNAEMSRVA